ncbi:MAG: hypothetical protein ACXVPU_13730 [Bacteroidia bacterium]
MKTTTTIKMILTTILLVAGFMTKAQSTYMSFQVSGSISGNGLGTNISPGLALTFKRNTINVGPSFQKQGMNFSGMQAGYRFSVAKNANGKLELFFSGNALMHTSAYMSKSYVSIEESSDPEAKEDHCAELKLKVVESYVGIGVKINPTKAFSASFSMGMGMYDTLNKGYDTEMYRPKSAVVMQMKASLIYNLRMRSDNSKRVIKRNLPNTKL